MATQRNRRRAVREKFRKRSSSWFRKGNELAQMTGADIYIVICHGNKYYTYKSTDRPGWPPSEQDIVSRSQIAVI
jgi:SRF-type transcription factor (DNA-binding and dimerisation domain)